MAHVEVFSTLMCPYCDWAKKLLESKGVAFEEIDVMLQPERRGEMTTRSGGRTSVPQIFVDGRHIGDCDEICALDAAGKLAPMLEGAN